MRGAHEHAYSRHKHTGSNINRKSVDAFFWLDRQEGMLLSERSGSPGGARARRETHERRVCCHFIRPRVYNNRNMAALMQKDYLGQLQNRNESLQGRWMDAFAAGAS